MFVVRIGVRIDPVLQVSMYKIFDVKNKWKIQKRKTV